MLITNSGLLPTIGELPGVSNGPGKKFEVLKNEHLQVTPYGFVGGPLLDELQLLSLRQIR